MSEKQYDNPSVHDYSCEAYYEDAGREEFDRFFFDDAKEFFNFLKDCVDQDRINAYYDSLSMHRPPGTPYSRIDFQRIDYLGPENEPWKADYQVLMNIDLKNQKVGDVTSNLNDLTLLKEDGFDKLEEKVNDFLKKLKQKNEVKMDVPKVSDHVIISLVKDCVNYCDPYLDPYENDPYCAKVVSTNGSFGTDLEMDAFQYLDNSDLCEHEAVGENESTDEETLLAEHKDEITVKALIEKEYGPCFFKKVCCYNDFIDFDSSINANGLMFMPKKFIDETGITDLEHHFEQSCKLINASLQEENAITVATFETERKTLAKFLSKHGDKEIGDFVEKLYDLAKDLDYPWYESSEYALNNDEKAITDGLIENNLQCFGDFDENAVHLVCEKGYQGCKLYGLTEDDQKQFEQMKEQTKQEKQTKGRGR